jgi:hypothetical protein
VVVAVWEIWEMVWAGVDVARLAWAQSRERRHGEDAMSVGG